MRIRSTKPEFWKSRRIASVSWDARLVLKGLESYVDDNGVGVDDIELIVTDVFPRDLFANPRETVARVSEAISELFQAGLVHRYDGPNDKLLYVSFWESVQRIDKPGKGRNPRPDGTFEYKDSEIRDTLASPPETLAPVTGEQGNRGAGEQRSGRRPPARAPRDTGTTGTKLPTNWKTGPEHTAWALEHAPNVDMNLSTQKFKSHYRSVAGPAQFKTDWDEAWRGWILGDHAKAAPTGSRQVDRMRAGFNAMGGYDNNNQPDPWTPKEITP
ncbi:hypothetical protein ACSYDW_07190 [Paeniglutamicibacter sp. R2-26]|uniref:hypothetical protein n=1 Tax=Paeniglutamicibacter sp. R2-26 TaxID=3144417 RepID=UPI003EE7B321